MVVGVFLIMKNKDDSYNKFSSPMPPHLTPEEIAEWEKEIEWEKQELKRRKREGFYQDEETEGIISKLRKKFRFKNKQNDNNIGYYS